MFILVKFFSVVFLVCSSALAYTPSEGNVTATLGTFGYKTNFSGSASGAASRNLAGLGLIALGDLNDIGSLEIAMFDLHKVYFREESGKYIAEEKEVIHITMGYRYWINPYFSSSLSFYSSYSLGEVRLVHSDFAPGTEIDTSARDTTEYGFDFALQGDIWSSEKWAVIGEARYSLSVTSKKSEQSDHYGVMLGVRYQIQEKMPDGSLKK